MAIEISPASLMRLLELMPPKPVERIEPLEPSGRLCCGPDICERCHQGQKKFVVLDIKVCIKCAYQAALLDFDVSMIQ